MSRIEKSIDEMKQERERSNKIQVEQVQSFKKVISDVAELKAENLKELIISGLLRSEEDGVDMKDLVLNVLKFLGVNADKSDLRRVRILKGKNQTAANARGPAPLVATFFSSSLCQKILAAKREKKIITNADVTENCVSTKKIFINEMLNKSSYQLLQECKSWAKANKYKYAWYNYGRILLKANDNAEPIVIMSKDDLQNLSKGPGRQETPRLIVNATDNNEGPEPRVSK